MPDDHLQEIVLDLVDIHNCYSNHHILAADGGLGIGLTDLQEKCYRCIQVEVLGVCL